MARRIRSNKLENRTSRLEQAPQTKPYTVKLAPCIHLGYRRNALASGSSLPTPATMLRTVRARRWRSAMPLLCRAAARLAWIDALLGRVEAPRSGGKARRHRFVV